MSVYGSSSQVVDCSDLMSGTYVNTHPCICPSNICHIFAIWQAYLFVTHLGITHIVDVVVGCVFVHIRTFVGFTYVNTE